MPTRSAERPRVVQCAREIGPGRGVSGPAWHLEQELTRLGYRCDRYTLADLGVSAAPAGGAPGVLRLWRDILLFSFWGAARGWWRYRRRSPRTVLVCHVDALLGDIFVVRALPKSAWRRHPRRWRLLLRNPLHVLLLARDEARFRLGIHRRIVVLSDAGRAELCSLYRIDRASIAVIPNGVDLERFRPSASRRHAVRDELGFAGDDFVLLFAGNEFERKGLRIVLVALRILVEQGRRCRLIVAGEDALGPFAREHAAVAGAVAAVGHRGDLERFYAAADALVLPAGFDVSPLVGREALASGLPILMTDVGGIRDYLRDGENGYFVRAEAGDVAEKVGRLYDDPALSATMSRRARESMAGGSWADVAAQYAQLIDEVAAEREST